MSASPGIRPALPADVPGIRAILAAHGNDGPIAGVDIVGPYARHLIVHHRALVATEPDGIVAFGAAIDVGTAVHLADLFVQPDRLGRGIGQAVLAAVLDGADRRTTFASSDPRALPLYVRAGLAALWPAVYVEGEAEALPGTPASIAVEAADPVHLARLERAWTGVDRSVDHGFWAAQADADPFVVLDGADPVGLGYGRARQAGDGRAADRVVVRPGADPLPILLASLRRAARGGRVHAAVPGPNPVLPALLGARFRVVDRDQFMASDAGLVDPARLLPNGGML